MRIFQNALIVSVSSAVLAGPALAIEDPYPAYNFQPSVIYSNPELIEKTSSMASPSATATVQAAAPAAAAFDPKYPAAYFTPTLIYPAR